MTFQNFKTVLYASSLATMSFCFAAETVPEKIKDTTKDAGRSIKKGANRVAEKSCLEGDAECAAQRAKNRVKEGGDATKDKAIEIKDKVD